MPTKYRFVTNGDYAQFYDDAMLVVTVHNTSSNISWTFDQTAGIIFSIDGHDYHTDDVGDISFDGTPITTREEFVTSIQAMFPHFSSGTADTIYTANGVLSGNRTVDLDGKALAFSTPNKPNPLTLNPSSGTNSLDAANNTGSGNGSTISQAASETDGQCTVAAYFNGGEKSGSIQIIANASGSTSEHTADTHSLIGDVRVGTLSTDAGSNKWKFLGAQAGTGTPDTVITIQINGVSYNLVAISND